MTTMTEELWQGMHDGLRAFIAKRVSDQSHAEDVLQDAWLRWSRQDVAALQSAEAWLVTVVTRLAIDLVAISTLLAGIKRSTGYT